MDGMDWWHPRNLDSGGPCRNDGLFQQFCRSGASLCVAPDVLAAVSMLRHWDVGQQWSRCPTYETRFYAQYGVGHAWLVDPLALTLEAFSLHQGRWLLIAILKDDDAVSIPIRCHHVFIGGFVGVMIRCYIQPTTTTPDGICNPVHNIFCLASGFGVCTKRKRRGCKPRRASWTCALPPPLQKGDRGGFINSLICSHPPEIPPSPPFAKGGAILR